MSSPKQDRIMAYTLAQSISNQELTKISGGGNAFQATYQKTNYAVAITGRAQIQIDFTMDF